MPNRKELQFTDERNTMVNKETVHVWVTHRGQVSVMSELVGVSGSEEGGEGEGNEDKKRTKDADEGIDLQDLV